MSITKISFLAHFCAQEKQEDSIELFEGTSVLFHKAVTRAYDKEAVFVLGPGPCGKTVDKLDVQFQEHDIVIIQHHDDGTFKEFVYQRKDVLGRMTIERSVFQ